MKVKLVGNWEFELIPESKKEEEILEAQYKLGHVHLVCKGFGGAMPKKGERKKLLLTPSLQYWKAMGFGSEHKPHGTGTGPRSKP